MDILKEEIMNKKKEVKTINAPTPSGKYSQAIEIGNLVFLSGQLPIDVQTNGIIIDNYEEAFRLCFKNLKALCEAANSTMDHIAKLNVFLTVEDSSPYLDKVLPEFFTEPYPARSRVFVSSLSKRVQIEIEAIVVKV
jgi:reactive intermediate/imine deaminase